MHSIFITVVWNLLLGAKFNAYGKPEILTKAPNACGGLKQNEPQTRWIERQSERMKIGQKMDKIPGFEALKKT
jgi:hypothetical protein